MLSLTSRVSKSFSISLACALLALPGVAFAVEPAKESVPGGALMLGAYILIWGLPLSFLWFNNKRLSNLEGELQELRGLLQKAGGQGATDAPGEDTAE